MNGKHAPNVLLFNPHVHDFSAFDFWMRPLSLLRLATRFHRVGMRTCLFDCMDRFHPASPSVGKRHSLDRYGCGHYYGEEIPKPECLDFVPRRYKRYGIPWKEVRNHLQGLVPAPDVVIISCMMTYWYPGALEASAVLREIFPHAFIVLVGVYPVLCPQHAEKNFRDVDFIDSSPNPKALIKALGERLELCLEPTVSPYVPPRYELLSNKQALPLLTSIGCPYRCEYCASFRLCSDFHAFPAHNVLEDIRKAVEDFKTTDFALYDDAFLIKKQTHAVPILEGIVQEGPKVRFHSPNALHAREIDEEIATLLYQVGFVTLRLGLEFSDETRQRTTGGKVYSDEFARAADFLKKAGFRSNDLGVYVLLGYPGQTPAEAEQTCRHVHDLGCIIRPAMFSPVPGTQLWEKGLTGFLFDPKTDPVLQNSSLMPWRSEGFPEPEYRALKDKINLWNSILRNGNRVHKGR